MVSRCWAPVFLTSPICTISQADMRLFLCPSHFFLDCGHLWAEKEVAPGVQFYPWSGEVLALPDSEHDEIDLQNEDPRLQHGLMDNGTGSNFVKYLPHSSFVAQSNVLGHCGTMGEPIFTTIRHIYPGDRIVATYKQIRSELRIPAVHLLRITLYHKYVEKAIQEAPCNMTRRIRIRPNSEGSQTPKSDVGSLDRRSERSESGSESPKLSDEEAAVIIPNPLDFSFPLAVKPNRSKRLLPCDTCGKEFDRPSLLERHIRTHTGERPYVCDFCNKGFSTSSSLNTHRRIHTGEKPHVCKICGKCFTASSNLYYHRMTHVKEKPHPCEECPRSFSTPGDLRNHMKIHNGGPAISANNNNNQKQFDVGSFDINKLSFISNFKNIIS